MNKKAILWTCACMVGMASAAPAQQERPPQFRVKTEAVKVPVVVMTKKGGLIDKLEKGNFRLFDNGRRQEITSFISGDSPLTMVLLLEYSNIIRYIRGDVIRPAGIFVSQIARPGDYIAMISFDIRPHILTDFTDQRYKLLDAVNNLVYSPPGFSESSLYDALKFVLQGGTLEDVDYKGLSEIKGRTGVLLLATGMDTLSKINYGQARKVVSNAGVPVYSIGVGELAYTLSEPYLSGSQRMTFLQAQNTLRTFSQESGGRFYAVKFEGALDSVLQSISLMLRHQYTLVYTPNNLTQQSEHKHEIKVLVDSDGDGKPDNQNLDLQYRKYYYEPKHEG